MRKESSRRAEISQDSDEAEELQDQDATISDNAEDQQIGGDNDDEEPHTAEDEEDNGDDFGDDFDDFEEGGGDDDGFGDFDDDDFAQPEPAPAKELQMPSTPQYMSPSFVSLSVPPRRMQPLTPDSLCLTSTTLATRKYSARPKI